MQTDDTAQLLSSIDAVPPVQTLPGEVENPSTEVAEGAGEAADSFVESHGEVDNYFSEAKESFANVLSQFEESHSHRRADGSKQIDGTVVAVTAEGVFVDIGFKTEGILPAAAFAGSSSASLHGASSEPPRAGDKLAVTVKGRNLEGYYELSLLKMAQPKDWSALEQAFADKAIIAGTVTGLVKGGLTVDVGVRAFLPASRSGSRDASELEKLVGQEIRCRILKLEVAEEDVVVDRRAVVEEEDRNTRERRYGEIKEGDRVQGVVRTLTDYGAFVEIGGVDALLHVSDIAWTRVLKPADVLTVGEQIDAVVLKVDSDKRRISIGTKQLLPHPWDAVASRYKQGDRVRGRVSRIADFGAFVELEPGVEGLIHLSEMSWAKKVKKAGDMMKPGESVEAMILGVNAAERRISLGLKQTLGDPWADVEQRFPIGGVIEGPVTSFTKFGAFVQVAEGVEGMIHVSEITAEKHIQHPQDVLKNGQRVKAQVLEVDKERRQLKLSMKKLIPLSIDEYLAEHKQGDVVTGRVLKVSGEDLKVELGEGIEGWCRISATAGANYDSKAGGKADMSALGSMLKARWTGGVAPGTAAKAEPLSAGQIRSFTIAKIDAGTKKIDLKLN